LSYVVISLHPKLVKGLAVTLEARQVRAWEMLSNGNEIKRINENAYRVKSQSGNGSYLVVREGMDWTCECPDFVNRQVACKHIFRCFFSLSISVRKSHRRTSTSRLRSQVPTRLNARTMDRHMFRNGVGSTGATEAKFSGSSACHVASVGTRRFKGLRT
jgi:hypothetical protein